MKYSKAAASLLALLVWLTPSLKARIFENFSLRAFGAWAYSKTDGTPYLAGDEKGDYNHSQLYLKLNVEPFKRLSAIAQIGGEQSPGGFDFRLDYAFAQWEISDLLKLRIGKVQQAIGIYGDILNMGMVRPFLSLPQSIYGPSGFVGYGLTGIGLSGIFFGRSGWGMSYDLYWGWLKTALEMPNVISYPIVGDPAMLNNGIMNIETELRGLLGGRLSILPPVDGLRLGFSGYYGKDQSERDNNRGAFIGRHSTYGVHLELFSSAVWLRSEYILRIQTLTFGEGEILETLTNGFYLEAAVRLLEKWQAAVRYDWSQGDMTDLDESALPRFFQENLKHREIVFGLNYWLNSNLVLKGSYHMVEGIKFAFPHFNDPELFLQGDFSNRTKLVQLGLHFTF